MNQPPSADARRALWEKEIGQYLAEIEPMQKESARSHRFAALADRLLGVEPDFIGKYTEGIEKALKVKQEDRILRGRADNLFGNVVIEFEASLPKKQAEAEEQIRRYVAILWSQEKPGARTPYMGIATDGVRFMVYTPTLDDAFAPSVAPEDVRLEILEQADWTKLPPEEVYYWLDRYLLRKEILTPTGERIVRDFGARSHAFQTTAHALLTLWRQVKKRSDFAVVFESWDKYLRIVYGSDVAGEGLFMRHTYLATLAKTMAWMRLTGADETPGDAQIADLLAGGLFKAQEIENFIEEDFFSWLARPEARAVGVAAVRGLFGLLRNYDLRRLSEDVLKSLYQELVDPETRHDLGEYYTPDWLAHRIVNQLLDEKPDGALLDPACGSGTFLYLAIQEKRKRLGDTPQTLAHILASVCAADVHPLAVIVAKTNYMLALGDLLKQSAGTIALPVYLADTLRLPEKIGLLEGQYEITLDNRTVYVDDTLLEKLETFDRAVEAAADFARQSRGKPITPSGFGGYLKKRRFADNVSETFVQSLFPIAQTFKHLMEAERDSIWAFVLKNSYKPIFFRRRFDFVVGNPPWISFRFMYPSYQAFLKRQITQEYELLTGTGHLITHMEIATLFLVRAADLYLKTGGTIAFVLPRSPFTADQHDPLRRRTFRFSGGRLNHLYWREIWDCEGVEPLFSVPTCVIIADKRQALGASPPYPVPGKAFRGRLPRKNALLSEAEAALTVTDVEYSLHTHGKRSYWATGDNIGKSEASHYKTRFAEGATIVPRSFWFVRAAPMAPLMGINPNWPPLETDPRAISEAKVPYKDVHFRGNVSRDFLYATLLSTDLLPFGHLDYRMVVLPLDPKNGGYALWDAEQARENQCYDLAEWLERVEAEWRQLRSAKAENMTAVKWLNYRSKLTLQNPHARYRVVYPMSATYLCAAVVEKEEIVFPVGKQAVPARGFVTDYKLFAMETEYRGEAFYMASVLNSPTIDALIKPMQSRGLWGPRDICGKVLELPISRFQSDNPTHLRLAEIGEACHARTAQWLAGGGAGESKNIGRLRSDVRTLLARELQEIDALTAEILK